MQISNHSSKFLHIVLEEAIKSLHILRMDRHTSLDSSSSSRTSNFNIRQDIRVNKIPLVVNHVMIITISIFQIQITWPSIWQQKRTLSILAKIHWSRVSIYLSGTRYHRLWYVHFSSDCFPLYHYKHSLRFSLSCSSSSSVVLILKHVSFVDFYSGVFS